MHPIVRRTLSASFSLLLASAASVRAQSSSIAAETDILAYGISGYSGIVNYSHRSGLQVAAGIGRYDMPAFLLKGEEHYETAKWQQTATSLQVARVTWRFNGPLKDGPAVGVVLLNQKMRLRSEPLGGETRFRQLSVGVTGGYYLHVGRHFYLYPTVAVTRNSVPSGSTRVNGTAFAVEKYGPNASLHIGWDWGF